MAINDIIDIDELLDEELDLNAPLTQLPTVQEPMTISPGAYAPREGDFISSDVKNFLVDKLNIKPQVIDAILGKPYSWRDRFINLSPVDAVRDIARLVTPGDQPLEEGQQAFGINLRELVSPRTADVVRASTVYDLDPDKGAPYQVQKDATYLPKDQFDRGIKVLLKEAYPNTPLEALEIRKEPRTNRVIYRDPETGKKQFVSPPGIDWADVTAIMEPVSLELGGGLAGLAFGTTVGPAVGGTVGGGAGLLTTAQISDNPFIQATGTVAGATAGAVSAPITFTTLGEGMSHLLWRYSNLKGMKERGILDETYTPDKILEQSISDAIKVGLFGLGGNAAFGLFAKFMGANPIKIGVTQDDFVKAWDNVKEMKAGATKAEERVLEDLTTPEVLALGDVGTPGVRGVLQKEAELSAKKQPDVELRLMEKEKAKQLGYADLFEETGIDPLILKLDDTTEIKQAFGRDVIEQLDPATKRFATDEKALINKLNRVAKENTPENFFDQIWKAGEISNTQTLIKLLPDNLLDDFKTLIYRDFVDQTAGDPKAVGVFLTQHGNGLKNVFGDEFYKGLTSYNKLIKDIDVLAGETGLPANMFQKIITGLVRAYVGIFTRPGRFITAAGQVSEKTRKSKFEKMILDPETLYNDIKKGNLLENEAFMALARSLVKQVI
jgi:hypothetical protein